MADILREKELTIGDKTFRVKKFTPQVACYWVVQMFGSFLAIAKMKGQLNLSSLALVLQDFIKVDQEKWIALQNQCMDHVIIRLPAGDFPAINKNGSPADESITAPVMLALSVASYEFSMRDFFDPAILEPMKALIPPAVLSKILDGLKDSSTPPSGSDTGDNASSGTEPTPSPTSST